MPDKSLRTISATQSSALFDQNPYVTRWLLWRIFAGLDTMPELNPDENERMLWGTLLEPAIFYETLRRLNVEGEYNEQQSYIAHDRLPIGCTPDGMCFHPSRGTAVVQVKCVDWLRWKDTWNDTQAPPHIEIQLQHEMLVKGAKWGVISCLVGGNELRIYEREPDKNLQADILTRVKAFLTSIEAKEEPDPLGDPMEVPKMLQVAKQTRETIDLSASEEAYNAMQALKIYDDKQKEAAKIVKKAKATLLKLGMDANVIIGHGYGCEIKISQTNETAVMLPAELRLRLEKLRLDNNLDAEMQDAVIAAYNWKQITRRAGSRATYRVFEMETDKPAPWLGGFDESPLMG